jgi:hypothetical protein
MKTNKLVVPFGICFIIATIILAISVAIYAFYNSAQITNNFNRINQLIYEITIDGHTYIVNKNGGILLKP